ncbi:MAG TPA: hypothetical protein VHA13_05315 [Gammaproteobacteria bacterium]|nr:hypothetical protein [Gammaproteobacteria bacterium]
MKFKNKAERLQHPILSRIPDRAWDNYFYDGIDDSMLALLEKNLEEKHEEKLEHWVSHDWQKYIKTPYRIFFLINFFFPLQLSSDQFIEIGKKLELSLEGQLSIVAHSNNLDAFDKLIKVNSLDKIEAMVGYENILYKPFRDAAEYGSVDVLNRIAEMQNREYLQWMISYGTYDAFRYASIGKSPSTMKRLLELCAPEELQGMLAAFGYFPFCSAAQSGNLDIVNLNVAACDPRELRRMMRGNANSSEDYFAFKRAAKFGHKGILERLVELCSDPKYRLGQEFLRGMIADDHYKAFRLAAEHGQKDVIMYLIKISPPKVGLKMVQANDYESFRLAAKNNYVEVMELLRLIGNKNEEQAKIASANYGAFHNAAGAGNHEAVDYLIASCDPERVQEMFMSNDCQAFREAAKNNQASMVLRLIQLCDPNDLIAMISSNNYEAFSGKKTWNEKSLNNLLEQYKTDLLTQVIMCGIFKCGFTGEVAATIFSHHEDEKFLQSILYIIKNGTAADVQQYLNLDKSKSMEEIERIYAIAATALSTGKEEKITDNGFTQNELHPVFKEFSQDLQNKLKEDYDFYLNGMKNYLKDQEIPSVVANIMVSYAEPVTAKKQPLGLFKPRFVECKEKAEDKGQDEESKPGSTP